MKITLETLYTPWTLDTYNTFNETEHEEGGIIEGKNDNEFGIVFKYDDFDFDFDNKQYLNCLGGNLVDLLEENILDEVITAVSYDGKVVSPAYYNYETDKAWIDFEVDKEKLDAYIEANRADFEKEKIHSVSGFMWFGDDEHDRLNYYLRKVSAEKLTEEAYFYEQRDRVPAWEHLTYTLTESGQAKEKQIEEAEEEKARQANNLKLL